MGKIINRLISSMLISCSSLLSSCIPVQIEKYQPSVIYNFENSVNLEEISNESDYKLDFNKPRDKFERYVVENIDRLMEQHREELCLPYFDRPNVIVLDKFQKSNDDMAYYFDKTIYFSRERAYFPEGLSENELHEKEKEENCRPFEILLKHELGHYYAHMLRERMGINNFFRIGEEAETSISLSIVSEGFAEYFGKVWKLTESGPHYLKWPPEEEHGTTAFLYNGGFLTLETIIKHKMEGIEFIHKNPPSPNELFNLLDYQKRALEYLENK